MSELDDAMLAHIKYIVLEEGRSFSYFDFFSFTVDGKIHCMQHGTFRNKISELRKKGIVEISCRSSLTFYTLKGYRVGKPVTPNHTVVTIPYKSDPVYKMLQNLPFDKQSIHNIRIRLKAPSIWHTLQDDPHLNKNEKNKDLSFPEYLKESSSIRVTIHKTDTVSIVIGCSLDPIPLDTYGVLRLFTLLARVEERLSTYLINYCYSTSDIPSIPNYKGWIITMWHFGRDALTEYSGEKYSITVGDAEGILTRIYSKRGRNGKMKIRIESQEYPHEAVIEAVQQRMNSV